MEGAADLSSQLLSSSNWEVYKDAFAPPPPKRPTRAWERAPVAAYAPRLRGQKIWKKVKVRPPEGKENDQTAQEELEKAGNGPRKKPRLRSAKESIGDAKWLDSLQPHKDGDDALTTIKDKGRTSVAARDLDAMQMIPRKRTNADRLISPRKSLRSIPLDRQSPNISPMTALPPVTDKHVRKRKSVRKSTRLSTLHQPVGSTAEPSGKRQRKVVTSSGIVDSMKPASAHLENLYLPSESNKESEAKTHAMADVNGPLIDSISSAAQCDPWRGNGIAVANSLQMEESNPEDPLHQMELNAAEHNLSTGTKAISSGLLLREAKAAPEKNSLGQVGVFWDRPFVSCPAERPTDSPQKSKEAILSVSFKQEPPTVGYVEGRENATVEKPSPNRKKLQRRVSQRIGSRRNSRNTPVSLNMVESAAAQETVPPEISAQPGHQDDITAENQFTALFADAISSFDAVYLPETNRTSSTEAVEAPILPAICPPIDQGKDDLLPMIEPKAGDVNVSVLQNMDSPCLNQLTPAEAEKLIEIGAEMIDQIPGGTSRNDESGPNLSCCFSGQSLVEELSTQILIPLASHFQRDSSSHSLRPEVQLYNPLYSSSTPDPVTSAEFSCNKTTIESLALPKAISAPLSTTEPLAEAMEGGEQDITNTTTFERAKILTESTAGNTLVRSYDNDDTDMLRNFLTRVKANKAANAEHTAQKRRKSLPHSPLRLPLGDPDGINGSPSSPRAEDEFDVGLPTPLPNRGLNSNTPAIDDRDVTETKPVRRSGRTKLPVKSLLPAPCFIPVRRLGQEGDNTITLRRNVEKELAALTRVNTRKNKGAALFPADVLAKKIEEKVDPVSRQRALKEMFDDKIQKQKRGEKGKHVAWAEELAQYKNVRGRKLEGEQEVNKGKGKKKTTLREEQNSAPRRGIASKFGLGMAANGTPAPKRKVRGY